MLKSFYYQFINFIQEMPLGWFVAIWVATLAVMLLSTLKFFKKYNGTQKNFEKVSLMIIAILLFALLVYITYVRY